MYGENSSALTLWFVFYTEIFLSTTTLLFTCFPPTPHLTHPPTHYFLLLGLGVGQITFNLKTFGGIRALFNHAKHGLKQTETKKMWNLFVRLNGR